MPVQLLSANLSDKVLVATVVVKFVFVVCVASFASGTLVGAADGQDGLFASIFVRDVKAPAANFVGGDLAAGDFQLQSSASADVGVVVGEVGQFEAALHASENRDAFFAELGDVRDVKVFLVQHIIVHGDLEFHILVVVYKGQVGAEVDVELDDLGVLDLKAARAFFGGA